MAVILVANLTFYKIHLALLKATQKLCSVAKKEYPPWPTQFQWSIGDSKGTTDFTVVMISKKKSVATCVLIKAMLILYT